MAQPKLGAQFFADATGNVTRKAPPVKRSEAFLIYQRDGGRCRICNEPVRFGGNSVSPFEAIRSGCIDHVFPRSRGGQNSGDNLQLACMSCNSQKGAK